MRSADNDLLIKNNMYNPLLSRELNNLIKINKIGSEFIKIQTGRNISELKEKLLKLKTKEHREKVDFYIKMLSIYEQCHNQDSSGRNHH